MKSLIKSICAILFCTTSLFSLELDKEKMAMGEQIYIDTCVYCHGENGRHTGAKLIVNPRDLRKTLLTEEQSYKIIKDGAHYWGAKADIMPSFKSVLNEDQLRAVTYYVHNNFNSDLDQRIKKLCNECEPEAKDQDAKMKKWGKKIWKRNCQFCHGVNGKGDGIATKNPVDSIFPYDLTKTLLTKRQIFLYVKYGGKHFGTDKNDMPSWSKKYSDFKIRAIARYIDEVIKVKN